MSQAGALNGTGGGGGGTANIQNIVVQTGTSPVVTANNTITFNGAVVAAGTNPVRTDGTAPATMALEVQTSQAIASTNAANIGLAAFDSADFTVDANGFVQLAGGGGGITEIDGDLGTGATGSTITFNATPTSGATVNFDANTSTVAFNVTDASNNTLIGNDSGNGTISGANNTALGFDTLSSMTSGNRNTAIGVSALSTLAGQSDCVAVGYNALTNSTVSGMVAVGPSALQAATIGANSTAIGNAALANDVGGVNQTACGYVALSTNNGGNFNTAFGCVALGNITTGSSNVAVGNLAGQLYSSSESSNIVIGNRGTAADSNTTRIGVQGSGDGQQNRCFVAGITGVTTSNSNFVTIDTTTGQLGATASGGSGVTTIDGDTGSATGATITFDANPSAGASVNFSATGSTVTLNVTDGSNNTLIGNGAGNGTLTSNTCTGIGKNALNDLTSGTTNTAVGNEAGSHITSGNNNVLIGNSSGQFISTASDNTAMGLQALANSGGTFNGARNLALGGTAGFNYTGTESDNVLVNNFGTVGDNHVIRIGIQGSGSFQQNTCFVAGIAGVTTSNSEIVTIDTTTGQLGSVALSTVGITTINGDSGSVTGATVTIEAGTSTQNSGSTVSFVNSGTTSTLNLSDAANVNTILGSGSGASGLTCDGNTSVGSNCLSSLTNSSLGNNTCIGYQCLNALTGSGGTGSFNTAIGQSSLVLLTTGDDNICLGSASGQQYTSSESQNILIGNGGTTGESNVIRIGTPGPAVYQQTSCFISGIAGVTVSSSAAVLIDTTTGQLGTVASSLRYKHHIQDMDSYSQELMKLRPVSFIYKSDANMAHQFGLIAEEVNEWMPNLVVHDKEGRPDSVKYHELPIFLLAEIQKLRLELDELKRRNP